ncbi:MAG: helix-turn-helix domain-containing protein [Chthoniobacteraceae bacterium]
MNGSIGQALRDARLAKKLTIEEVARATKIRPERISDLEADDYMGFPNIVYARNFLILYAKYLGVDISRYPTVEIGFDTGVSEYSYLQQQGEGDNTAGAPARKHRRAESSAPPEKPQWLISFFIFLVAFAAAALVTWGVMTIKRLGPVGAAVPPKGSPTATASATATARPGLPGLPAPKASPAVSPLGSPASRAGTPEPVIRAVPVSAAAPAESAVPSPDAIDDGNPQPELVKIPEPVVVASPVASATPEAAPTPVVEGEEQEIAIRSNKKIRLRVVRDDPKSPSVYHGNMNPLMKPLTFVGKHFWIKTADPASIEVTINGKPAPDGVVEILPTQGI